MRASTLLCLILACIATGVAARVFHRPGDPGPALIAEESPPETIEVWVAARDIPDRTTFIRDNLDSWLRKESRAKGSVPAAAVAAEAELEVKRVTRTIRAGEVIDRSDLAQGKIIRLEPGKSMVSIRVNLHSIEAFVEPGTLVDVLVSVQMENKVRVVPILVNVQVMAIDADSAGTVVSLEVDRKQAQVLGLAKKRHCDVTLLVRSPDAKEGVYDEGFNLDEVLSFFENLPIPFEP